MRIDRIDQFVLRHQRASGGRNDFGNFVFGKSLLQGRAAHQTGCSQQQQSHGRALPAADQVWVERQNSAMSGLPTASLSAANTSSNDRDDVRLNRSTSTLLIIAITLTLPTRLRSSLLVHEPLTERLDFHRRVRRKKVIDVDVSWGDQDRLGMCHRVETIFTVVVSDP